jgi:hypothetical protein
MNRIIAYRIIAYRIIAYRIIAYRIISHWHGVLNIYYKIDINISK